MALELYSEGITIDTVLILPCDVQLVSGLRELWRDINNTSQREYFFSPDLFVLLDTPSTESWADFCAVIQDLECIIVRAFRRDRHYLSADKSDYSCGRVLRCQWFFGETFDEIEDQALRWGAELLKEELNTLNNHAALSAALVGAHND